MKFLNKYKMEKFGDMKRGVVEKKEKVNWCLKEKGSDK